MSQNSSAKDSDSNSYDSPASSPKNVNKLIQPELEETLKRPVKSILDQSVKILSKCEEVNKSTTSVEPTNDDDHGQTKDNFKEDNLVQVNSKPMMETLFGPEDILKPNIDESRPVHSITKVSHVVHICKAKDDNLASAKPVDDLVKPTPEPVNPVAEKPVVPKSEKPVNPVNEPSASTNSEKDTSEKSGDSAKDKTVTPNKDKPVSPTKDKPISPTKDKPVNIIVSPSDDKQANATTVKPANPSTEKPVEGKPKIAVKPVLQLAPRFFDKPVNLRAVLQNGLGLKPTFKIRPMLSLSRYYLPNIKSPFCNRFNLQDKPCSFLHSYQKNSRKWVPYREVNDDFKGS